MQIEKYLVFREGEVWAAVHDELVHEGVRPGTYANQATMMGGRHTHNIHRSTRTGRSVYRAARASVSANVRWHCVQGVRARAHCNTYRQRSDRSQLWKALWLHYD